MRHRRLPVHTIPVPTPYPIGPVNVYLIARDPVTLVDTGPLTADAWSALEDGLARRGFRVEDVERVLLTHGHQDHYGLARRIERLSGARVLGGALDRGHFRMERSTKLLLDQLSRHGFGIVTRALLVAGVASIDTHAEKLQAFTPLSGGEVLPGDGWSVAVHAVPGHTPGSLAFEVPEARLLLTGDTVLRDVTPNAIVDEDPQRPGETFRSVSRYLESLEALAGAGAGATLLTGHGRPVLDFAAHREKVAGKYRRRIAQLEAALAGRTRTVREVVEEMFPGIDAVHVYLAYSEVLGFLMYLEDQRRVEAVRGERLDRYRLAA